MEDDQLVRLSQRGDKRAYGRLVERHQSRIYATLAKMTGDGELAMDLTQDAFVRAWEKLDGFRRRASFSTWLYRIAIRLAYDAMDRRKREAVGVDVDRELPDPGPSPERRAETAIAAEELRAEIEALPEMQRAVVVLRARDGLPYRKIARILETSESSARVSFHYAVKRLRANLEERAETP